MKRRVQVWRQVKDFMENLAPEPRRRLKSALRALEMERGVRLALRERLAGYHRLRVGGYRLIFRYLPGRVTECVFAEERSLVYQLFEREVLERLRHEEPGRPWQNSVPKRRRPNTGAGPESGENRGQRPQKGCRAAS